MQSESKLVELLKSGDKKAIHQWYSLYSPKLRSFFASKVRQAHDADELVHDVFLSCLSSLPLYRGESKFYSWMLSIARHELADYYRKLYAKRVILALPIGDQLLESASHEATETTQSVKTALSKLPGAVTELLALKYIDRLSVEGIARKMSVTPHVVQSRLYRARLAFRRVFEELDSYEKK